MSDAYFGYFRPRQRKYPTTISVISDQLFGLSDHFSWNKLKRNIFNISKAKHIDNLILQSILTYKFSLMEVKMGRKGLSMNKAREILRLKLDLGLGAREIAKICSCSHSTVLEYERKAHEAGLKRSLLKDMDDEALINTLSIVQKDFEKKPMPNTENVKGSKG